MAEPTVVQPTAADLPIFEQALAELAAQLQAAHAAPNASVEASERPSRWGEGDPRHPAYVARSGSRVVPGGLPQLEGLPQWQRPQAELRSTNPAADWWVEKGMPPEIADPLMKFGRATGDTAADLAGRPIMRWGARKIDALSSDVARMAEEMPPLVSPAEAEPAKSGQETPEEIMRIQREMQAAGKYMGPIDGLRGGATNKAIKDWAAEAPARAAAEAAKRQQEIDAGKNAAGLADAKARAAETKRVEEEATRRRSERGLGEDALRESDRNVPAWQQVLRNDGEALGWAAGGVAGHLIRAGAPMAKRLFGAEGGIVGRSNAQSQSVAEEVNGIIDNIKNKDWHARVGDVNEVWRRGQPAPLTPFGKQPEVPFASKPGQTPPWTPNPEAPAISELYRPNRLLNLTQDIGIPAAGAVESGIMHYTMRQPAEAELAEAQKAYDDNPNSASNIQRLQEARTAVGTAKMAEFFGRGTALGYTGSAVAHRRTQSQPNLNAADSERGRINDWLTRSKGTPDGGGKGPPPRGSGPPPAAAETPSARSAAALPEPAEAAPALAPQAPSSPRSRAKPTASSSSPDLPEHLDPTPWGIRNKGNGQFTSNPGATAQSKPSKVPGQGEQTVKAKEPDPPMSESGTYIKPPLPIQEDTAPYGMSPRSNGRGAALNSNRLLDLMG